VRVIGFPIAVVLVLGSLLLDRARWRTGWRWGAALLVVMGLTAAPWMARNAAVLGQPSYAGRSGPVLLARADKAAAPLSEQLGYASTAFWVVTYPLSALFVPTSQLFREPNIWDGPLGELELMATTRSIGRYCQSERTVDAADACYSREAMRLLLQHPVQYVLMTGVAFVQLTFYIYPSKLSVLRNWVVLLGLGAILWTLRARRLRRPEALWLMLPIVGYTLPAVVVDPQPRYGVPLVPFYSLFAAVAIVALTRAVVARGGRAGSPQPARRPSAAAS